MKKQFLLISGLGCLIAISGWFMFAPAERPTFFAQPPLPPPAALNDPASTPRVANETAGRTESSDDAKKALFELARKNPSEAFKQIATTFSGKDRELLRHAAINSYEGLDVQLIVRLLADFESQHTRTATLLAFADKHSKLVGYPRMFEEGSIYFAAIEKNLVCTVAIDQAVQAKDYVAADNMLGKMPYSEARDSALSTAALGRASDDAKSALQWASNLPENADRLRAVNVVLEEAGRLRDLSTLQDALKLELDSTRRNAVLTTIAGIFAEGADIEMTKSWIRGLPTNERGPTLAAAVNAYKERDMNSWIDLINEIPDAPGRSAAVSSFTSAFAERDLPATAQWVLTVPADSRRSAIGSLVLKWYNIDSEALSVWATSLPKGNDRDYALSCLAQRLVGVDKSAATEVANAISNSTVRDAQVLRISK